MISLPIGALCVVLVYLVGLVTGWVLRPVPRPPPLLDVPRVRAYSRRWVRRQEPDVVRWSEGAQS